MPCDAYSIWAHDVVFLKTIELHGMAMVKHVGFRIHGGKKNKILLIVINM